MLVRLERNLFLAILLSLHSCEDFHTSKSEVMGRRLALLVSSYLMRVFCIAGATYMVVNMTRLYFEYRVTTVINIQIDDMVSPYATTICVRYTDILDYQRLEQETGRKWRHVRDLEAVMKYKENLTVAEIFEYTPGKEGIVDSIIFRVKGTYQMFHSKGVKDLETKKFLFSEFICYKIALKSQFLQPMPYDSLSVTTKSPGLVYEIRFSDSLSMAHYMRLSLAPAYAIPRRSLKFQPIIRRGDRSTQRIHNNSSFQPTINYFFNSVSRVETDYLPAPYETDCLHYRTKTRFSSDATCHQTCVEELVLKNMDLVTFTSVITKPYDKKMIVNPTFLSQDGEEEFHRIHEFCDKGLCRKRDCRYRAVMTTTTSIPDRLFRSRMMVPNQPSIRKKTFPKTDFIEYFTFVSSAISTWIGISVLWFDPINVMNFCRKRRRTRRRDGRQKDGKFVEGEDDLSLLMNAMSIMNRRVCRLEQDFMMLVKSLNRKRD